MFHRNIDRLYEVIDGVVYDSEDCIFLHCWRRKIGPVYALWRTPDGHCFMTMHTLSLLFGPCFRFAPISRINAIEIAAARSAPDAVLRELGVDVQYVDESDVPCNLETAETVYARRSRFAERTLLKSSDGRYLMFERCGIFGMTRTRTSPMIQREAIAWALENGARGEVLEMLGIRSPAKSGAGLDPELRMESSERRALVAENRRLRAEMEMLRRQS